MEVVGDISESLYEILRCARRTIVVPVDYSENMKLSAHLKEVCRKG